MIVFLFIPLSVFWCSDSISLENWIFLKLQHFELLMSVNYNKKGLKNGS